MISFSSAVLCRVSSPFYHNPQTFIAAAKKYLPVRSVRASIPIPQLPKPKSDALILPPLSIANFFCLCTEFFEIYSFSKSRPSEYSPPPEKSDLCEPCFSKMFSPPSKSCPSASWQYRSTPYFLLLTFLDFDDQIFSIFSKIFLSVYLHPSPRIPKKPAPHKSASKFSLFCTRKKSLSDC